MRVLIAKEIVQIVEGVKIGSVFKEECLEWEIGSRTALENSHGLMLKMRKMNKKGNIK